MNGSSRRGAGLVHALPYDTRAEFWSVPTWQALSEAAADHAVELARQYDELLVIAVDTPFAGVGEVLTRRRPPETRCGVNVLLAFYGTALIVERPRPSPARVAWEQRGIDSANEEAGVWVGDVGRFLSCHLRSEFGLRPGRLAPFTSSLDLASPDLQPMPVATAREVVARWKVPLDRPLVVTIGRTDPTKGIDLLIHAVGPLRDAVHLVIIAVPFGAGDPLLADYARRIAEEGVRATLITEYTRELPRAVCGLPETGAVVCPARGGDASECAVRGRVVGQARWAGGGGATPGWVCGAGRRRDDRRAVWPRHAGCVEQGDQAGAESPRGAPCWLRWAGIAGRTRHRGPLQVDEQRQISQLTDPFGTIIGVDGP